jgi:UDP-N-acetylglucosamine transferase subunit ALG13
MIFVSVGSMLPFNRLVQTMDGWAQRHPETPVVIQYGDGSYQPRFAKGLRLIPAAQYRDFVTQANLFVAHAGMGSIITAIQAGKPLLMLPRLQSLGEHNTDHQLATARNVGNRAGLHVAADADDLLAMVDALLAHDAAPPAPISRFASDEMLGNIRRFIHQTR